MRAQLLEKINGCLTEPITREMQVVYLMVEIRKFLEQNQMRSRYPSLNFHCCWVVHSKATGLGADRILQRFDEAHPYYPNINAAPAAVVERIGQTMGLGSLKIELRRFLAAEALSIAIVDDHVMWLRFLSLYFGVVEDCPFVLTADSQVKLNHLSQIVITRHAAQTDAPEIAFGSLWRLIGKNGDEVGKYGNIYTESEIPSRTWRPASA